MFSPAVWISHEAWPTNEKRTPFGTRAGGVSANGDGAQSGHCARPPSRCQRSRSPKLFGGDPSGSKKRTPSK